MKLPTKATQEDVGNAIEVLTPVMHEVKQLQQTYWTFNTDEYAALTSRNFLELEWRERFRLHHLMCMLRLHSVPSHDFLEKCKQTVRKLISIESPYRPLWAGIWVSEEYLQVGDTSQPAALGDCHNSSMTHLGSFEVVRYDPDTKTANLEFIPFGDVLRVTFNGKGPVLFLITHSFQGELEMLLAPSKYGIQGTQVVPNAPKAVTYSLGAISDKTLNKRQLDEMFVGHQSVHFFHKKFGHVDFPYSSIVDMTFPLEVRDPMFEQRARRAGHDPAVLIRKLDEQGRKGLVAIEYPD